MEQVWRRRRVYIRSHTPVLVEVSLQLQLVVYINRRSFQHIVPYEVLYPVYPSLRILLALHVSERVEVRCVLE